MNSNYIYGYWWIKHPFNPKKFSIKSTSLTDIEWLPVNTPKDIIGDFIFVNELDYKYFKQVYYPEFDKILSKEELLETIKREAEARESLQRKAEAENEIIENEIKEKWARKLSKLADISLEEALIIAQEKLDYKQDKINEMEEKQSEHYSQERGKLIKKMQKENPLRLIKNKEHAEAILAASNRHKNTNYEELLQEAREKASYGEIDKGDVKDYARQHFKKFGGIINDTHSSLGSSKELGISPIVREHDMIAECGDCGDKFSYQNSKNHILWECPDCKSIKRIS